MNKLTDTRRAAIVRALCEGNSVRATARRTATSKATVLKLLVEVGEFCSIYQDHAVTNLKTARIEADEIWSFVGAKQKNAKKETQGDIWTYTAIDADSKLMISWLVGPRNHDSTFAFMADVAGRLAKRAHKGPKVQLTTDGLAWYVAAVEAAFGYQGVDFAQIIKTYGTQEDESGSRRYSPMVCTGVEKISVFGNPDMDVVSTSYVERANLSIRMGNRRFTRLTNGFSKKAENHAHAFSLFAMHYNYCRPHMTLTKEANGIKTTPAMASGLTDHVWTVGEVLEKMSPEYLLH
jgi:IS1 family transposase